MAEPPSVWTRRAFAPAHLTGFFEIRDEHANPYHQGSRGAGLNIEVGVEAKVTVREAAPTRTVRINGVIDTAPVVHTTLSGLLGDAYPAAVEVDLSSPLPASQGFGLSGAGALSTGLALAAMLGFPTKNALWEAHKAEVTHRTGLGDVPAQFVGGAEIRVTPGPMPIGVVERFAGLDSRRLDVVCCTLDVPISTRVVLGDAAARARINAAGAECVEKLRAEPTLARYMALSTEFAARAGLTSPELADALLTARRFGPATQTMLGNSLHLLLDSKATPASDVEAAMKALSAHGQVVRTKIAQRGAHALPPDENG